MEVVKRKVARLELSQITQHFRLGVVRVEDRMGEKFGSANCGLRNPDWRFAQIVRPQNRGRACRERPTSRARYRGRRRFVERNADRARGQVRADCSPLFARALK